MVADLAHLTGQYEMSICSIGVMGVEYVRSTEVIKAIEIKTMETTTI